MKNYLIFLIFLIFFPLITVAYAEKSIHLLTIDEHSFELKYELNGDVIAMALDQELTSLLIGIENTNDSLFSIELPNEMIRSDDNEFAVLVDGLEVDYEISINENSSILMFFVPDGAQEIEIIGTYVIPEFSFGAILGLVIILSTAVLITKIGKRDLSNNLV